MSASANRSSAASAAPAPMSMMTTSASMRLMWRSSRSFRLWLTCGMPPAPSDG